ncbi:hypothetical protein C2857_005939 [Epichloe festucae Fl1]|uniref:N(6)-L-threonylcarbamoyladenine synthase n=1 Tax=Epichloe festucae (strain Fl1) TaxID=877507 RepID=A0A7S9PVR4_EPIFF|nr:hypothetical protein C2857_005939 [Epichloe festucae Fl1]
MDKNNYFAVTDNNRKNVDDWEEWEDDEAITPIEASEQVGLCQPPTSSLHRNKKKMNTRGSRLSTAKIRRLKSRQRQKAQNAKAGIRLITDMSAFRRNNHVANHAQSPKARAGKFVDAAALRALEGEPNSASVGNWNWLKKSNGKSPASATPTPTRGDRSKDQELSPEDRPIVIGISLPSSEVGGQDISPETALVGNQFPRPQASDGQMQTAENRGNGAESYVQRSAWSPDTPNASLSFSPNRAASSLCSQALMPRQFPKEQTPPPVPALPSDYKKPTTPHQRILSLELGQGTRNESESGTPCTLFEEDGVPSPQRRRIKAKGLGLSPDSAGSRSHGWWDHVVTPFVDKTMSFSSRDQRTDSPKEQERNQILIYQDNKFTPAHSPKTHAVAVQAPIVRAPTPRRSPSPRSFAKQQQQQQQQQQQEQERIQTPQIKEVVPVAGPSSAETPRIVVTRGSISTADCPPPPPYSPPKKQQDGKLIRYRAVFPPGHPLHSQFPPSPRPASPGLAATMSSQGGAPCAIDHIPALARTQTPRMNSEPLPVRPKGNFVPQEHVRSAAGTRHKVERQRRRHEKEDIVARRAGGFWRGRGCIPSKGCFGRTGREGRQRRRVWMAIWGGMLALLLLVILLAVLLTRHHGTAEAEAPSVWVNLTDFPPMPTGVLTVVGPDNTAAKSGCTEPSSLWSCSLPKDQQSSVVPYRPNQPTLIVQIQWDNSTSRTWNVPDGDPPTARVVVRRAYRAASFAKAVLKRAQSTVTQFTPNPAPPKFKEMWFLGETTDNIKSDQKGGEPAPFYISLLNSANEAVVPAPPRLTRRESSSDIGNDTFKNLIPPPDVEADGTSVPAVMMPNPVHQPVRLFDRGLPTEHYGFYTYFKRTIFLKSVTIQNQTEDTIPLDKDGGCRKTEASHLVTWGETRLHVQIWTRFLEGNTSSLLRPDGSKGIGGTGRLIRPGTMPYPVTITQDTHGGDPAKKLVWARPVNERLQVQKDEAQALVNDMGIGGTWVNRRNSGDAEFGGFDGGNGGCKSKRRNLVTLAIESSCDDTAVAVLSHTRQRTELLFNERISSDNRAFKGVHPVVAVQGHNASLAPLVQKALQALQALSSKRRPDFVSVTRGPGIVANLAVGLNMAKGLSVAWGVPLVGVHHMQAHALTPRLVGALHPTSSSTSDDDDDNNNNNNNNNNPNTDTSREKSQRDPRDPDPSFPFLTLLVSGGHTQLVHSAGLTEHHIVANTGDIAIGNLLDQTARVILPPDVLASSPDVMYGRLLEQFAFDTPDQHQAFFQPALNRQDEMTPVQTPYPWTVPLPFRNTRRLAFSFSSIHTHVHRIARDNPAMDLPQRRCLARHTMRAAFQHLASRLMLALQDAPELRGAAGTLVVSGGVASNRFLMHVLRETLSARGFPGVRILAPPAELCTDNAAMIAWAAMEMFETGWSSELGILPVGKWPMSVQGRDAILAMDGWMRS